MTKLDYSLDSPEERNQLVAQIIAEQGEEVNPKYLEVLGDYLILCMEKQERKQKKILTENRLATVNKRETSFEGLACVLENGEDGVYNLINENKNQIFRPKITITKKDIAEIADLAQLREGIEAWEHKLKHTEGKQAFTIKRAIIEMRKDQYLIKDAFRRPIVPRMVTRSKFPLQIPGDNTLDENGQVVPSGISLCDWKVCSTILCNYSRLKEDSYGHFDSDLYYLMESFDRVAETALHNQPVYEKIVIYKIDGMKNDDIADQVAMDTGTKHTPEYISNLWRNKIPKLIAEAAKDEWLDWYYLNVEKGQYKKCNRCGQIKLATNRYFSRNSASKDGWYSICKECRNQATRAKKSDQ